MPKCAKSFITIAPCARITDLLLSAPHCSQCGTHCYVPGYPGVRLYKGKKISEGVYRCNVQSERKSTQVAYSAFGTAYEATTTETRNSFCIVTLRECCILIEEDL